MSISPAAVFREDRFSLIRPAHRRCTAAGGGNPDRGRAPDRRADRLVGELAYGQQRQLEIALALAGAPRFILFDEPAAGLSPTERAELIEILTSLPKHIGFIIIEHDMDVALRVVESVTMMHNGRIFKEGRPEEIESDRRGAGALPRRRPWLTASPPASSGPPVLEIRGLNVFYGRSHALQGVDLTLQHGVLSVVGRNGMGKTTLCKAIMGLVRASSGSIRFAGEELVGRSPADIARLGIGYVPQGRRLWRIADASTSICASSRGERRGAWTSSASTTPSRGLPSARAMRGSQLSGGEQQMLAISRALLLNPRLLVMDEPTEGLAPVIVAQVEDMLVRLREEGEIAVLVIEQNIGVATEVAETVAIMVNGRINRVIDSRELAADRDLQQRLLGVGRHGHEDIPDGRSPRATRRPPRRATRVRSRRRSGSTCRTRCCRRAGRSRCRQRGSRRRRARRRRARAAAADASAASVGAAAPRAAQRAVRHRRRHARHQGRGAALHPRHHQGGAACRTRLVDLSTTGQPSGADVPPTEVALHHPRGAPGVFTGDRGAAVAAMTEAFEPGSGARRGVAGIISAGGSGGTAHGDAGDAGAAGRRAEAHDLDRGLRQRRGLCRPLRHHDDVFGHRRAGPQRDLASRCWPTARRRWPAWSGAAAPKHAPPRSAARGEDRPRSASRCSASRRPACSRSPSARGRLRLPGVPRHRHRRPVDGEAGRRRHDARA